MIFLLLFKIYHLSLKTVRRFYFLVVIPPMLMDNSWDQIQVGYMQGCNISPECSFSLQKGYNTILYI